MHDQTFNIKFVIDKLENNNTINFQILLQPRYSTYINFYVLRKTASAICVNPRDFCYPGDETTNLLYQNFSAPWTPLTEKKIIIQMSCTVQQPYSINLTNSVTSLPDRP
jgi:hypothetical protein